MRSVLCVLSLRTTLRRDVELARINQAARSDRVRLLSPGTSLEETEPGGYRLTVTDAHEWARAAGSTRHGR
ncbi:hypothetical protein AAHZ94_13200 [Streptomyces sp. HSW2009]|uniref:hypothetical protein n=1 Tax=Streptomyces sp. HSW2009 TaxID=3142890 RepID=UPI0032EE2D78